jgi:hypothetical protein
MCGKIIVLKLLAPVGMSKHMINLPFFTPFDFPTADMAPVSCFGQDVLSLALCKRLTFRCAGFFLCAASRSVLSRAAELCYRGEVQRFHSYQAVSGVRNKEDAKDVASAYRTQLCKGEVGIEPRSFAALQPGFAQKVL